VGPVVGAALLALVAGSGCGGAGTSATSGGGGGPSAGLGTGGVAAGIGGMPAGPGGGAAAAAGTGAGGGAAGGAGGASQAPAAGCDWTLGTGSDVAGTPPASGNSADLRGPALGDVPFVPSTARRIVLVKVGTSVAGLSVGQAYLTRSSFASDVQLTIPVMNGGTDHPCFIAAESFHYLSSTGTLLNAAADMDYVIGSVGDMGNDIYTHSCLAPGETGYFLDSRGAAFFTSTASMELDLSTVAEGTAPAGHLTPKQYELGTCAGLRSLRVMAVNDGASTVTVAPDGQGLGPAVLLDGDGLPAGWIFVEDDQTVQLMAGQQVYFATALTDVAAVTRAQFFLDFDPPAPAAAEVAGPPTR
jgi:hypothetical protein